MNLSKRNKKVAISRWKSVHANEKSVIPRDKKSFAVKSAICGFLAGDGSVQKRKEKSYYHHQIDFFPDDKVMIDAYIRQMKQIYNKSPSIKKQHNFYSVRIASKTIFEDLKGYAKFGVKTWTLPLGLLKTEDAKKNWLKAFFSAEAYVNKDCIRVQTINKRMMQKISKMLNEMSITNNYYEYTSKNKSECPVGIITIPRKASRLKFYNLIGFWHEKKSKTLKEALGL